MKHLLSACVESSLSEWVVLTCILYFTKKRLILNFFNSIHISNSFCYKTRHVDLKCSLFVKYWPTGGFSRLGSSMASVGDFLKGRGYKNCLTPVTYSHVEHKRKCLLAIVTFMERFLSQRFPHSQQQREISCLNLCHSQSRLRWMAASRMAGRVKPKELF